MNLLGARQQKEILEIPFEKEGYSEPMSLLTQWRHCKLLIIQSPPFPRNANSRVPFKIQTLPSGRLECSNPPPPFGKRGFAHFEPESSFLASSLPFPEIHSLTSQTKVRVRLIPKEKTGKGLLSGVSVGFVFLREIVLRIQRCRCIHTKGQSCNKLRTHNAMAIKLYIKWKELPFF